MHPFQMIQNLASNSDNILEAIHIRNPKVLKALVGPATRGYVLQRGKGHEATDVATSYDAHFVWQYGRASTPGSRSERPSTQPRRLWSSTSSSPISLCAP